ncbi:MAG: DUF4174 domain-containing protein [Pseudomonadota bacterium]
MSVKILTALALAFAITGPALATGNDESALTRWQASPSDVFDAAEIDLAAFQWVARPVIVFADSPLDPAFQTQMENLAAQMEEVIERDIVMITDTNAADASELRKKLRPRGFQLVLIGKDGAVKLRKPFPWDMRELSRTIDKMPMRQRELQAGG